MFVAIDAANRFTGMAKRGPKSPMTDAHKEALATGRTESRAVRDYLEALEQHKPKRGRKRTAETIERRLSSLDEELDVAEPLDRLKLIQERMDLLGELDSMEAGLNLSDLEEAFVEVAANYSERQGISYAAWREIGVQPAVLKRAGISRAAY
jgi:hypothetical protein